MNTATDPTSLSSAAECPMMGVSSWVYVVVSDDRAFVKGYRRGEIFHQFTMNREQAHKHAAQYRARGWA